MNTNQIIQILEKAYDGKDYIITSPAPLNIDIQIPADKELHSETKKIFESLLHLKREFTGVERLNIAVNNMGETNAIAREIELG